MVGRKRDVGLGPAFGEDPINLADWRRADCCDRKGESFRWGGNLARAGFSCLASKISDWLAVSLCLEGRGKVRLRSYYALCPIKYQKLRHVIPPL